MRVAGYVRVSTSEQARHGLSLASQREAITRSARTRGWKVVEVFEDAGASGRDLRRPAVKAALEALRSGRADTLVVARLDRLSRSVLDVAKLLDRARKEGWSLHALDAPVDLATPQGELQVHLLATFARYERRLTGERTRAVIERERQRDPRFPIGAPRVIDPKAEAGVRRRIRAARKRGESWRAIAEGLNAAGVKTPTGKGRWHASGVRRVARRGPERRRPPQRRKAKR